MIEITNPDGVKHPRLKELMDLLSPLYKSEFPVKAVFIGSGLYFTDSRRDAPYPQYTSLDNIIGYVEWDGEKLAYVVHSQRIKVAGRKPRRGTAKVRSYKRTKSLKSAVKLALQYLKPFDMSDLMRGFGGNPRTDVAQWAMQPGEGIARLTGNIPTSTLLEEVMHLVAQGVQFKTDAFNRIAQQGLELSAERKRRERERDLCTTAFLFTQPDGRVSCTFINGREASSPFSKTDVEYPNEDAVPSVIQDKIALLRFSDEDKFIPEVGRRVHKAFWVVLSADEMQAINAPTPTAA